MRRIHFFYNKQFRFLIYVEADIEVIDVGKRDYVLLAAWTTCLFAKIFWNTRENYST